MVIFFLIISLVFIACEQTEDSEVSCNNSTVIVSLQDSDSVAVVSASNLEVQGQVSIDLNNVDCSEFLNQMECEMAGCMWHIMDNGITHCMSMDMGGGNNAPHDIAVDNTNGYWFTTAMSGFKVGMYSTETNELISSFERGSTRL